ncbi:metallophosphoesterase [Vineibacter terrae]|uniref:metallophosphoesterase family protein n=1 Tax=Vineibacter terrae TaxID=2586908 RepID=UPI002E364B19|nr:metallophosphoesterase [Vineibacter terrae]HEX2888386.1 metallophosphoesterase [Vineibacter terrae]
MYSFAHLSDPHLPLPPVRPGELLSKRLTGWLSWTRRRRHIHRPEALAATLADVRAASVDHIVVTGDIANISTAAEFRQAAAWLAEVGPPDCVSVIPGNHDAYVRTTGGIGFEQWSPYLAGDDGPASPCFPAVRRRGPVAFVGLSTAVPMPVFIAAGTLGAAQIARFEAVMRTLAAEGLCRVVLIHHPPQIGGAGPRKGLTDAAAFRAAIERVGAELVLHGHNHRTQLGRIATPDGGVPVLGAASASAAPKSMRYVGGYNLIRVAPQPDGWAIDVEVRVINSDFAGCTGGQRFRLPAPRPVVAPAQAA